MLKQIHKERLKALGINVDDLEKAIKDDKEVDVTLPEGEILTPDQLTTRDSVKLKEGEKEGEKKAITIAKTEIKKHAGIDLTGERWGDIGTEIKNSINATGDAKLKGLQDQNTALIADNQKLTNEAATIKTTYEGKLNEIEVMSKLPGIAPGLKSLQETHQLMTMRGYAVEKTDAGFVVKDATGVLKHPQTHEPLPLADGLKSVWEREKWNAAPAAPAGGRGAGQKALGNGSDVPMNKTQAEASFKEMHPDKNINSPEGMAYYQECAKVEGFNMYE